MTLVGAGTGPADGPAASWAPAPGALPASPAAEGIEPSDVDTVVLTHLRTDHVGWAVVGGDRARPFFPDAEYLLRRAELDAIGEVGPQPRATVIDPLRVAGQLRLLAGDTPLRGGGRVCATPGRTPGHQSVLVTSGRERAAVTGGLHAHAVQLLHPELAYVHETDPERAGEPGRQVLHNRTAGTPCLATPHPAEPFVVRRPALRGRSSVPPRTAPVNAAAFPAAAPGSERSAGPGSPGRIRHPATVLLNDRHRTAGGGLRQTYGGAAPPPPRRSQHVGTPGSHASGTSTKRLDM
ncbi:MBL fold metallo-hydrolase [Streptomyces sp. NPDC057325]|uniref:MBL fold metallo-hydrolase n=1 Tax=unclassified Streptomyces TaxID=2593676 RepID=UPI003640A921